ncbi:hypothetical protein D3C76_1593710 [compost metagenome]
MDCKHTFIRILGGNHRGAHGLANRMELVISGNLFDDAVAILLEQDEVPHVIQKQLRLEKATHHRLQLHLQARTIVFV